MSNVSADDYAQIEAIQSSVSKAVQHSMDNLESEDIRPVKAKVFRCSAKCCEDRSRSNIDVQSCIDSCARPLEEIDAHLQSQLAQLQDRMNRCGKSCADRLKDRSMIEKDNEYHRASN
ncbi:hypothetical protein ACOME3_005181 [Neoechinorhynchus agilis]